MGEHLLSDEDIVREVLAGNDAIFKELVVRYQNTVYGIGMRFFHNTDDACDFTQEAFVRAYQHLASFQGKSAFRFWLYRVAFNFAVSKTKAVSPEVSVIEETYASDEPQTASSIESSEIRDILMRAVNDLPEQYRVCVDLFFFGNMTYAEINYVTGFPVNTVKSNVFRAKQLLRQALTGTIAEEYHEL